MAPLHLYSPPADMGPTVKVRLGQKRRAMCLETGAMKEAGEIAVVREKQLRSTPDLGERVVDAPVPVDLVPEPAAPVEAEAGGVRKPSKMSR